MTHLKLTRRGKQNGTDKFHSLFLTQYDVLTEGRQSTQVQAHRCQECSAILAPFLQKYATLGFIYGLIRVYFQAVFLTHAKLSTKLAILLLESSSVADPVRIDPHHFGMPDPQQKKQDAEPHQSQNRKRILIEEVADLHHLIDDPDPHQRESSDPHQSERPVPDQSVEVDPAPHQSDADPHH